MSIKDMAAAIIEQVEKGDPIDPDAAAAVAAWAQEAALDLALVWAIGHKELSQWEEGAK